MSKKVCWTKASFECYDRDCVCSPSCSNYSTCMSVAKDCGGEPPMKKCVEELLTVGCAIPLAVTGGALSDISEMNARVMKLWVLKGMGDKEIANALGITEKASHEHRCTCYGTYKYYLPYSLSNRYDSNLFPNWAKTHLMDELERLERIGVVC